MTVDHGTVVELYPRIQRLLKSISFFTDIYLIQTFKRYTHSLIFFHYKDSKLWGLLIYLHTQADAMISIFYFKGSDSRVIWKTLRERIGKSLRFGLLTDMIDTFSSTSFLAWDPLGPPPLFVVFFYLRLSTEAEFIEFFEFLILVTALASLSSRVLRIFLSPLSKTSWTRSEKNWN